MAATLIMARVNTPSVAAGTARRGVPSVVDDLFIEGLIFGFIRRGACRRKACGLTVIRTLIIERTHTVQGVKHPRLRLPLLIPR